MIKIRNLHFAYGENVIFDKFTLDIDTRLSFLMGKNGAGKTTLLKLIHADLKGYTGEIVSDEAFMVSQSFMLFDDLSAIENIAIAIDMKKEKVLSLVETSPFYIAGLDRKVKEMRAIEKGTLELIAMSLSDKKLILLDEVSGALDSRVTQKLIDYIKTSTKSFLMVSHDSEFISAFDAEVIYLNEQKNISSQASHIVTEGKEKKITGIYIKDEAALEELMNKYKSFAYVAKDVREEVLMDEKAYKNIFIYEMLANTRHDYEREAEDFIKRYKLKFKPNDITSTLSGGNLQKLVFFREIGRDEKAYILYNYKKGMDFEAKALAQEAILKRRDEGKTIYIISDDYEELKEDIVDEIKVI